MSLINKEKVLNGVGKAVDVTNKAADKASSFVKEKEIDKKAMKAAKTAEKGIKSINPSCHTSVIPIADGGEGLLDVLITATKGKYITLSAHGPLMKMAKTHYGLSGNGRTAIIEMAAISGLPLVPIEQRNPMLTTTFGTGELIKDALNKGCRNFIIGIGGSATNDAGLGMLQALGFRFLDKSGHTLGTGGQIMEAVANIDTSGIHPLSLIHI